MNELFLSMFNLEELILNMFSMECTLFMQSDSYRLIEQKCKNKCLNSNEMQQLNTEVHSDFILLIKAMKEACPSLTDEDILFCCLAKSGLDHMTICHCLGNINKQPENQRKYRIKKKMKEAQCDFLFDMIFTCNS